MPNIFKRISDVLAANLNDLIDRVEDPERMAKQIIREMEDGMASAKRYAATAIAAERRIGRDPAFAREVAFWEERLGGLADAVPPVEPPLDGWARIEAALARADRATEAKPGFWHNLPLWRGLALASAAEPASAGCLLRRRRAASGERGI